MNTSGYSRVGEPTTGVVVIASSRRRTRGWQIRQVFGRHNDPFPFRRFTVNPPCTLAKRSHCPEWVSSGVQKWLDIVKRVGCAVEIGWRTESKKANPSRGGDAKPEVSLRRDGSAADLDIP
jgi:hypothetical protein